MKLQEIVYEIKDKVHVCIDKNVEHIVNMKRDCLKQRHSLLEQEQNIDCVINTSIQ